jgi:hypothetical protein
MSAFEQQRRKCEICGAFFWVPLIGSSSSGVRQVRLRGPWTCDGPHPEAKPGRRLERDWLGNILERGQRVRR